MVRKSGTAREMTNLFPKIKHYEFKMGLERSTRWHMSGLALIEPQNSNGEKTSVNTRVQTQSAIKEYFSMADYMCAE